MQSHFTYVDNVNSNLICCICRMPFVKPVVTTTCSHTFCNDCIVTALSISSQCPVDRYPLAEADLQPANPIVQSLVDELIVECPSRQRGCFHTCQRQLLATHLRDQCNFVQIPCCEDECQERILRKDIKEHLSVCKHRVIRCRGCGDQVKAIYIEDHYRQCSTVEIACSHCNGMYHLSKVDQHEAICSDKIVTCDHATHGCVWSGARHALSDHVNECPYESIKDFLSLTTRRISFLEGENLALRNRVEALEISLRLLNRDMESTKTVIGPWFTRNGRSEVIRPSSPVEPAPQAYTRGSSNEVNSAMFSPSLESGPSALEAFTYTAPPNVNTFDSDPLSHFFPPENNFVDAPPAHMIEGTYRQALSSSIAPLNLNTTLVGSLNSLRSSLITLASSLDSEIRRHDIALVTESSRVNEEVMALRAVVHGLRMQVHQIMMDRNSQLAGRVDGIAGSGYSHSQPNPVGEFGPPGRYLVNHGHPPPIHRPTSFGTTSYIQTTKL